MLEFLSWFVSWLSSQTYKGVPVIPPEATEGLQGAERENKTWLMEFPEDVVNAYCIRQYNGRVPRLPTKDAGVRAIQLLVRNRSHLQAITNADRIFKFLKDRPEMIEDLDDDHWAIIAAQRSPVKTVSDMTGSHIYSLSFSITTSFKEV